MITAPETTWLFPDTQAVDQDLIRELSHDLQLPPVAVQLLVRRGLTTRPAIEKFLNPGLNDLADPLLLPDMDKAVDRLRRALNRQERILIAGDYDVDGTTGTALLVRCLRALGAEPDFYVPHRQREGYGLSEAGVRYAHARGCRVMVTVDCGITDIQEVALANQLGIDVIVTDHHETGSELPPALAIVNPKLPGARYPFPELCGGGIAFRLAQALTAAVGKDPSLAAEQLDLAALATIADIVPLTGENRILAKLGLARLEQTRKPGLRALLKVTGLSGKKLNSYHIGFVLGPRINASGRMAEATRAVRLLLTDDPAEAEKLAGELNAMNQLRRGVEETIAAAAIARIEQEELARQPVLVLADEGWHEGVIGIVASRLVEQFLRPAIVIALDGELGKGSGRSIPGFDLYEALKACAGDLLGFGGHKYAAGLQVNRAALSSFVRHINEYAATRLSSEICRRQVVIDARVSLADIDQRLYEVLKQFEPYGPENPEPRFAALGLEVVGYPQRFGNGNSHLRLRFREGEKVIPATAWQLGPALSWIEIGRKNHIDIIFGLEEHEYAGKTSLRLRIQELRRRQ